MKRPISGLRSSLKCEICEDRLALHTCSVCGRSVCDFHFNEGVCAVCEMSMCEVCGKNLSIGYCELCGSLVCDRCVGVSNGSRRICKKCIQGLSFSKK
ncbi:hypothetical protein DFR87_10205 [Metallosphaera hakonensis JCM 8857 = DSM 7519]|uniref:B box-type domain-containing protein n=1 Tax=Metallosphaera hakonensis JCM 8857 = DSM 7519 TaxID=1293036 RepID=A0A2U9IVK1_9CREN|nr:hypothetical protein DFR87_10205 [Metallosphaera hakonensis JCM 8857 = DSM 7519]